MTASDRFDLLFADALEDLAGAQYPDYFDDALDVATRRSQRPAWTFLERWIPMDTATRRTVFAPTVPWRQVGLIIVIIALVVAATAVVIIGSQPATNPAPPFGPAANGLVAYAADGDIFIRDMHGGPARKVTETGEFDISTTFSRDGTQLAFLRLNVDPFESPEDFSNASVFVALADGSDQRQIFSGDDFWGMSWSVDGSQVALIGEDDGARSLYVVNTADGTRRALPMDVEPFEGVQWRPPDGNEIIFRGRVGENFAIYGVHPDGSGFRRISDIHDDQWFWTEYAISPDGATLLYSKGGDRVEIRMIDLDTGEDTLWGGALPDPVAGGVSFTGTDHLGSPVFSPDGRTIAFGRYWDETSESLYHQVFVATLAGDGADARPIGEPARSRGGHNPFTYAFSPDGQHLIVQYNEKELTWLADPTDGSYEVLPWGKVVDVASWQRVAPD